MHQIVQTETGSKSKALTSKMTLQKPGTSRLVLWWWRCRFALSGITKDAPQLDIYLTTEQTNYNLRFMNKCSKLVAEFAYRCANFISVMHNLLRIKAMLTSKASFRLTLLASALWHVSLKVILKNRKISKNPWAKASRTDFKRGNSS